MATATATPPATVTKSSNIAAILGVETMPLTKLRELGNDLDIAKAWAAGEIEFGRTRHCVTGPVGKNGSVLVIEDGVEWSGPKTKFHKTFRDLITEDAPKTEKCKKYVPSKPTQFGEEVRLVPTEIDASEAHAAIALQVRLTDKGLGES